MAGARIRRFRGNMMRKNAAHGMQFFRTHNTMNVHSDIPK
ncbi:hypothetical protein URH17368_2920 [Alicyclobacillus hesperidum URH17-3-68]|nr:hypothetical protein URH17368_2920 [Alicyclobacillus hesperidum URH17-3-68]